MKFIRAFILAFLLLPLRATASDTLEDSAGREAASHLRISLLTCSKGGDISSAFGHSALRVTDSVSGRDMVFNYGTFDFYDPGFLLKFLHGDLYYFLSVSKVQLFREFV